MGPDYARPEAPVPEQFRFAPEESAKTADTAWWQLFGDPALENLIDEALANNQSVKIAAANVEAAMGIVTTTASGLYPQLGAGLVGMRREAPDDTRGLSFGDNPQSRYRVYAAASWEIDLWGRVRRQLESAEATLQANVEARRGVVLSLVAQLATLYFELRGLDEQLEIAERTRASYAEAVRLFELQFQHGVVPELTVAQARSQYETAAAAIPEIERRIAALENAISVLAGRNPGPVARGLRLAEISMPAVPSGLPSEVLERRPDLRQAEQELIAANALIGAAKAQYFPSISLTGLFGYASENLSKLFDPGSQAWAFLGNVSGPIFTAGRIEGDVALAEARQKAALASYRLAIQNAFADTENALVSRRTILEQFARERARVDSYRDFLRLSRLQYDGGYTPYLTVIFAETQLFPAELNATQVQAATFQAIVAIYRALAGGWVDVADRMTVAEN